MREVFIHQDSARVGLYKSILEAEGIEVFVRNEISNNSVTDLPSPVFFPALCVVYDDDYERALDILRKVHKPEAPAANDWKCASCGEDCPGTFDTCWRCGATRGETSPSSPEPIAPPQPISPPLNSEKRFVDVFRFLLIVLLLYVTCFDLILPRLGVSFAIPAVHPSAREFLEVNSANESAQRFWGTLRDLSIGLQLVTIALCMGLSRYGRNCAAFLWLLGILRELGRQQAIYPLWVGVLSALYYTLEVVILTMMFLPPLARRFSKRGA